MSTHETNKSRWLDWKPAAQIMAGAGRGGLTKPTKAGSVSFVSSLHPAPAKIEARAALEKSSSAKPGSLIRELFCGLEAAVDKPPTEDQWRALRLLNASGARIVTLEDDSRCIGLWTDLDSQAIRTALHVLGMDGLEVRYLDGSRTPLRYKARCIPGEPVPPGVRAEMERNPEAPWEVRGRLLKKEEERN